MLKTSLTCCVFLSVAICVLKVQATSPDAQPLTIGETFTIHSKILREDRRINVYAPPAYSSAGPRLPVLYMPDGGVAEDFIHVAGLVQVLTGNGAMRPFLLVGIENTERRRDMTGPTTNAEDKKIAPRVGGSQNFRAFIREELIPDIERRYRTTKERAIVGESLAGLFVVETFVLEPDLFDTFIAFDPSLWWNDESLLVEATKRSEQRSKLKKQLFIATSSEPGFAAVVERFMNTLGPSKPDTVAWRHDNLPQESHATIYHPAALKTFRQLFAAAKQ